MARKARFIFNEAANEASTVPDRGLTLVVRTDAAHATASIKEGLFSHVMGKSGNPANARTISRNVHRAYRAWGHSVLSAVNRHVDYAAYGLTDNQNRHTTIHFYNAAALARRAIAAGAQTVADQGGDTPFFISFDEQVTRPTDIPARQWGSLAVSRLFSPDGKTQIGFTGRPGSPPVDAQTAALRRKIDALWAENGEKPVPVVLLEDNIRNTGMINRIIGMMDDGNALDRARIACIATCFCCAPAEKRGDIAHRGRAIPLAIVIDYSDRAVDVVTPRDLFFDGMVVDTGGTPGRLPALFGDTGRIFKIAPGHERIFQEKARCASIAFCRAVERQYGIKIPVRWMAGSDAIAAATGAKPDSPVIDLLTGNKRKGPAPAP